MLYAVLVAWLTALATLAGFSPAAAAAAPELVARGRYVFGAAGGCGCHTVKGQPVNSGGRKYEGPFGVVYSSNITPDQDTGIGAWTDEQIVTAIRLGRRPNGERLLPVHPFPLFNGLAEDDLTGLVAYLRTMRPVKRAAPAKQIRIPAFETVFLPAWLAAFAPRETPPASAPVSGLARGEYLVRIVGHCGECHTPRTVTYAPDASRFLAGTATGPEGSSVSNITPDPETGIGKWSVADLTAYLLTRSRPDGEMAGGLMGEVILGTTVGLRNLSRDDATAIAQYLKSIPPIRNKVPRQMH